MRAFHASRITHHASRSVTMDRRVEPEFLDELPASDPRAIRSRRDLRCLNAWMGNTQIMARALRSGFPHEPPQRLVELGAGDATFLLRVAQRLGPHWSSRFLWQIRCREVTRHDALMSTRAGFADNELSKLWPALAHGASTPSNGS